MSQVAELEQWASDYGSELTRKAKRNLKVTRKRKGKNRMYKSNATASSNLGESIDFVVKVFPSGSMEVGLEMLEYGLTLNDGRPPTKSGGNGELKVKLQQWIKDKKIKPRSKDGRFQTITKPRIKAMAYAMSQSIHKRGFNPVPFMDEAISQTNNSLDRLSDVYGNHFENQILRSFNKSGFKEK